MSGARTLREIVDEALPGKFESALQQLRLGTSLKKIRAVIAGMAASAAPDITAIPAGKITIEDGPDNVVDSGLLPPIGVLTALRVTGSGTATSLGAYIAGDDEATPIIPPGGAGAAVAIAALSDDGKTLTFPNTITDFVIEYYAKIGSGLSGGTWDTVVDPGDEYAQPSGGIG